MELSKIKTALIGSGMISEVYLKNLKAFHAAELVDCSDIRPERAAARAAQFGIRHMSGSSRTCSGWLPPVWNLPRH